MASKILLSLFAVLCLGSVLGKPSEPNTKFEGGEADASKDTYGYMVGITKADKNCDKNTLPDCLGTLIGEQHVITTGSCVQDYNTKLKVCIWNDGGEVVEKIYVNEHYRVGNENDVAVLKLQNKTTEAKTIEYYSKDVAADNKECHVIGLEKKTVTPPEGDNPKVDEYLFREKKVTTIKCTPEVKNAICVKDAAISAVVSDLGSPLICDSKHAGILVKQGTKNTELVYLKTNELETWIKEKVSSACTSTISLTLIVASIAATLFGRQ